MGSGIDPLACAVGLCMDPGALPPLSYKPDASKRVGDRRIQGP